MGQVIKSVVIVERVDDLGDDRVSPTATSAGIAVSLASAGSGIGWSSSWAGDGVAGRNVSYRAVERRQADLQSEVGGDLVEGKTVVDVLGLDSSSKTSTGDGTSTVVRVTARLAAVALDDGLAEDGGDKDGENDCDLHDGDMCLDDEA